MRITGGKYRGRRVKCPPGVIRPAMDRMRESLFSILGNLEGKSFLDLFSGSGIMGLEAASRGASPVVLVEKDPGKRKTITENLLIAREAPAVDHENHGDYGDHEDHRNRRAGDSPEEITLHIMPVQRFFRQHKGSYDIVYLDPPFSMPDKQNLAAAAAEAGLAAPGSQIIIHYPAKEDWPARIDGPGCSLMQTDSRRYGGSALIFYTKLV